MGSKKKRNHLPVRLNILFIITFVLFSVLIFRLGIVQIVQGEEYTAMAEQNTVRSVSVAAPRGLILDRNGEVLVDNEPIYTVTYTENTGLDQDVEQIASRLSELIHMDKDEIIDSIDEEAAFAPQRIKQDISVEEMFRVSEHLDEMPGVGVMVDSRRKYEYEGLLDNFLGKVGPIPAEDLDQYLAKGYAMNEWVGLGDTLEYQYEEQLRGTASETEIAVDRSLRPVGEPEHTPGKRGNDLVLTIDRRLQQYIEEVIDEEVKSNPLIPDDLPTEQPHFVMMDPHTGEILGLSDNVFTYRAGSYFPGSTVKMASVLMGLHEGVVSPYQQILDQRMYIGRDGLDINSWRPLGWVDAREAIQRSSNIYVAQVGLKMAGASGPRWNLSTQATREGFEKVRYYFAQFGLGAPTGIDLPNENEGAKYEGIYPGNLAFQMFGQWDHYTPLQLAQYVSTIANGGYRMKAQLVKEIRREAAAEDELSQVVWQHEPTILNRIEMSDEHIKIVQEGMKMVTGPGGTAQSMFRDFPVKIAGKTGTAQTNRKGINHVLFVGYAPADDPEVAFAALAPYSSESNRENQVSVAQDLTKKILTYYFEEVR